MTAFADPQIQALWDAGRIRAAYEASSLPADAVTSAPFRDQHERIASAQRCHEHGVLAWHAARYAESEAALTRAHGVRRELLGDQHAQTLQSQLGLAAAVGARGRAGIALFERAIDATGRVFGFDGVQVALARRDFAVCLRDLGERARARAHIDLARPVLENAPDLYRETLVALAIDAELACMERDYDYAIALGARVADVGAAAWNEQHPFVASAEVTLAWAEAQTGKLRRARNRIRPACERLEAAYGDHPELALALWCRGRIDITGEYGLQDAEADLERAVAMFRAAGRPHDEREAAAHLADVRRRMGKSAS